MYNPTSFQVTDPAVLEQFMDSVSFATLVSQDASGLVASHVPFLREKNAQGDTILLAHLARANDQWRSLEGRSVLAIVQGPHCYISPSWYETSQAVPTWNYIAVHLTGTASVMDRDERLTLMLEKMVDRFEAAQDEPWSMGSASRNYLLGLQQAIVGVEIRVTAIEGKWKLNQNHSVERRQRIINKLMHTESHQERAIAAWMQKTLPPTSD